LRLRIDPWDPEYGASVELDEALEPPAGLDLEVEESGDWAPVASGVLAELPCCSFIDGVRRIEARLFAEDGVAEVPGLAGSWAVGAAWSTRPPRIDEIVVGRELVVGGGLEPPGMTLIIGRSLLEFGSRSIPGAAPLDPLRGLQNAMRAAEAALAQRLHESRKADLVICDGPLSYLAEGPVVGMVKRQSRSYLDADRSRVLARLHAGERTPIFKFGAHARELYSWYLRLSDHRPIDGAMAGVVRLEVAASIGLVGAQKLASLAGAVLPRFAAQPGRDPRAPQNLYPVAALEAALRHRLGDSALIRRLRCDVRDRRQRPASEDSIGPPCRCHVPTPPSATWITVFTPRRLSTEAASALLWPDEQMTATGAEASMPVGSSARSW
jgi:uncharacterized protein